MSKAGELNSSQKKENRYIIDFLEHLRRSSGAKEMLFEAIPEESYGKSPDYYLPEMNFLVEVKELHDREMVEEFAQWSRIAANMEQAVKNHPHFQRVRGEYVIYTPPSFKFPSAEHQLEKAADKIVKAVDDGVDSVVVFDVLLKIKQIGQQANDIHFSTMGGVHDIEAGKTVYQNIYSKLETANEQLSFKIPKRVTKRIVLLVNLYEHADDPRYVVEGLSYAYQNLLAYENIDELWLQIPRRTGVAEHVLLYTGKFLKQYAGGKMEPTEENAKLYELWFNSLQKLSEENKERLFQAMKIFLESSRPHEVFREPYNREQMAHLGIWLAEKERFEEMVWLIERFIDDPDPPEPTGNKGEDFSYHVQIENGEDPLIITSTLGHLAWVIQRLVVRQEYLLKTLDYTARLLSHNNLYIKLQAIVPLIEIAVRRQLLDGWGIRPRNGPYLKFHKLVIELVDLVAKNQNCVAIADWLVKIFSIYKDLSTEELEYILDSLEISDESGPLFIYFGIFRERHYKNQQIDFDPEPFREKLRRVIKSTDVAKVELRRSIAWNFWKILEERKHEFDSLKPYIDLFFQQPFQSNVYNQLEMIIKECVEERSQESVQWFEILLERAIKYIDEEKGRPAQADVWFIHLEEILMALAERKPANLSGIAEKLIALRKRGVYIAFADKLLQNG